MNTIEFDDEHFVVSKEKDYGDPVGEFRVIRYDTGYYALQKKIIGISDSNDLEWETLVIAPQLDTPLDNGYDWKFSQGNLTMNMLLQHLENSSKLHNNELMELHLNLNTNLDEDVSEEIIEIIKSHDGKRVADKIIESVMLQDSYFKEHLDKSYRRNTIISSILLVICLTCFGLTLLTIFGVL
ncbi:MAG: hypothetical protein IJF83_07415 [Methanobrevibacter sp.]|nr:hypothetical protein [Methanobrevibacter sp.]